ncbi:MAG: 16S rRNA (adenine(1518)-N(6)/adenine(1519)-N(6))-dimethyltransferase RsmA [Patescibacteria group bacterium]|nr:16S rRNA (adenine(1518)-N(6)/adenine(1519)-N(6))-dimethyltransferase RsmA [Patescibacteria group bacterium]
MDLLEQTKKLCKLYHITPARSKGQNFLIKEEIYDAMAATAGLKPDDTVLEVGPGLGFLTAKLAARAGKVIAVELDDKLAEVLRTGLMSRGVKNVEVINEDILKISNFQFLISKQIPSFNDQLPNKIPNTDYKIVANLPYNITSIFLRKFLEAENKPELMVLMLQKEVAERITAKPGKMSLLSVSVQFYAQAEIMKIVPKDFFWPKPEVDSAIVKISPHPQPLPRSFLAGEGSNIEKEFFRLVKFGFSAKRKMLKNNLAAGFRIDQTEAQEKIKSAGFNEKIRAQELAVEDWLKLFSVFNENVV